jgi:polysaccharide export outer membrane protein
MLAGYYWLIFVLALWLPACASQGTDSAIKQGISQQKPQAEKNRLPEQLLPEMGRATITGYKDYEVGPEDLLEISCYGQDDMLREVRVSGAGDISLPMVGDVRVEGLSPKKIEERLKKAYVEQGFFVNPQITVFVKEYRHQRVMVTGAVVSPGSYEIIGPRTLLEVLGKVGGLTDKAGEVVHVIRNQNAPALSKAMKAGPNPPVRTEAIIIELRRLLADGAMELNVPIKNGDVVYVPQARTASILGAVKKPGQVPLKDQITVTKALALSEGVDPMFGSDNISILRFDDQGQRVTIPVNLARVKSGQDPDPLLKENDVIFVAESGLKRFLYNFKSLNPGSMGLSYGLVP